MHLIENKNAYVAENLKIIDDIRHYRFKDDDKLYFYKQIINKDGTGKQSLVDFFDHKRMIPAEVVNSKLAKYFDLDCVEYKVVYDPESETYGVASSYLEDTYGYVDTLKEYLSDKKREMNPRSLKSIKKCGAKRKFKPILNDLEKTVLFHCAIGQRDGHLSNIMVHNECGDRKKPLTGLTLIDNGYTFPAIHDNLFKLQKLYKEKDESIVMCTGIKPHSFGQSSLYQFYEDIEKSKSISKKSIETHLENAYNAIDRGVMVQIMGEIIEEYKIVEGSDPDQILKSFIDCNNVVLKETTLDIERAYYKREQIEL